MDCEILEIGFESAAGSIEFFERFREPRPTSANAAIARSVGLTPAALFGATIWYLVRCGPPTWLLLCALPSGRRITVRLGEFVMFR